MVQDSVGDDDGDDDASEDSVATLQWSFSHQFKNERCCQDIHVYKVILHMHGCRKGTLPKLCRTPSCWVGHPWKASA